MIGNLQVSVWGLQIFVHSANKSNISFVLVVQLNEFIYKFDFHIDICCSVC